MEIFDFIFDAYFKFEEKGIYLLPIAIVILFTYGFRLVVIEKFMIFQKVKNFWSLITVGFALVLATGIILIYLKFRIIDISLWNCLINVFLNGAIGGYAKNIVSAVLKIFNKEK